MKILLIEDDADTAAYVADGLREHGHAVDHVADGREGLSLAADERYELLIVDRMLPGIDGLAIVETVRAAGVRTPVLFLSTLGGLDDRVTGLDAGGDDYLVKPFAFSELLARLEAIVRRADPRAAEQTELKVDDLKLDLISRKAFRAQREIDLFPREFSILEYLMRNAGRPVTRTMLLNHVWNYQFEPQANVVDVHISRLRRKIDTPGERPLIETLRGEGYRIRAAA